MKFPENWPAQCPPADAMPAQGTFFRVVKHNPLSVQDFKSYAELGLAPTGNPCKRAGLSLLGTWIDAVHQIGLFPKHGRLISRGDLLPSHGMTLATKGTLPSHATWWAYAGVDRVEPFKIVNE